MDAKHRAPRRDPEIGEWLLLAIIVFYWILTVVSLLHQDFDLAASNAATAGFGTLWAFERWGIRPDDPLNR